MLGIPPRHGFTCAVSKDDEVTRQHHRDPESLADATRIDAPLIAVYDAQVAGHYYGRSQPTHPADDVIARRVCCESTTPARRSLVTELW